MSPLKKREGCTWVPPLRQRFVPCSTGKKTHLREVLCPCSQERTVGDPTRKREGRSAGALLAVRSRGKTPFLGRKRVFADRNARGRAYKWRQSQVAPKRSILKGLCEAFKRP